MPTTEEILAEYYSDPRRRLKTDAPQVDPYWVPPKQPETRGEIKNLPARPGDPVAGPLAENLSPTMGAYGMGQLLAETYGQAKEGDWKGLAANAPYLMGIFAGPRARTANKAMLAKAEEMAGQRVPREAIWKDTGWFQGHDGKWRWEIDDTRARVNLQRDGDLYRGTGEGVGPDSPFMHPELAKAYDTRDVLMRLDPEGSYVGGSYSEGRPATAELYGRQPEIRAIAESEYPLKGVALHELQHHVQRLEGFGKGSSPSAFPRSEWEFIQLDPYYKRMESAIQGASESAIQKLNARDEFVYDLERKYGKEWSKHQTDAENARLTQLNEAMEQAPGGSGLSKADWELRSKEFWLQNAGKDEYQPWAFDQYLKTPGEVEARNVEQRMSMSPEQRRETPPWLTENLPLGPRSK